MWRECWSQQTRFVTIAVKTGLGKNQGMLNLGGNSVKENLHGLPALLIHCKGENTSNN